ncbi:MULTISPECIES: hypothetical protein [unclassified Streptomyces]|uniref:hypothetical protein n=1 Tax=unclassified Streptomyces TaxID=2593676 RepID=UPI003334581D
MTEPVAPIDWARHYAAQREQQPEPVCKSEQGCHLVAPCNPGCGAHHPAADQPARHTVDTITPEALGQLHEDLREARLAADRYYHNGLKATGAAGMRALDAEQRAEQAETNARISDGLYRSAEATVTRAIELAERWAGNPNRAEAYAELVAALTEPQEARP